MWLLIVLFLSLRAFDPHFWISVATELAHSLVVSLAALGGIHLLQRDLGVLLVSDTFRPGVSYRDEVHRTSTTVHYSLGHWPRAF